MIDTWRVEVMVSMGGMMARAGAEQSNMAAVQAPAAASTYAGGLTALAGGITGLITAVVKVFNLPASPSVAQAVVVDGGFFLAAAGLISFAWVVVADFRSRSSTQSAALTSGAIAPAGSPSTPAPANSASSGSAGSASTSNFTVKKKDTGEVFPVLGVSREGAKNLFLINYQSGDQTFNWISEDEVSIVSA
jgi:hypothetical protein